MFESSHNPELDTKTVDDFFSMPTPPEKALIASRFNAQYFAKSLDRGTLTKTLKELSR